MKYMLVGIRPTEFDTKDGKHIDGVNIFVSYDDINTKGQATDKFFILKENFNKELNDLLGVEIDIQFNRYGKLSNITY